MEAKGLHGRHFTLQELLPSKNARVFSPPLDIVAIIWLSPAPCLLSCNFCCYFTPFLSIKHFSISSLLAIPLQAGKCQATPMSFYHSFCSSQNFYIGNNLYRDFSQHLWQVLQIFEIQGPSQSSKNSMLNLEWLVN